MVVIVRRRLRHSLVQRCGRSVRQCSLSCDTTVPRSTACCCLETDTTRPWAEWSSPSTRRRPVHLQVQVLLHATITQTWSRQTERVKKGAYTIPSIHACCRGTILASTVSLHTRAFLDTSATASGIALPFLSAAPHAIHNSVSSQPHQLTTRLSFCTGTSHQSHVCPLLSNTPSYAFQHVVHRECQLTGRQEGYMDGPQHDNKCVCPSPCLIQQA